jgi:hypothetical protein
MSENYTWPVWSKTNYSACLLPSEYFKEDLVETNIIEVHFDFMILKQQFIFKVSFFT